MSDTVRSIFPAGAKHIIKDAINQNSEMFLFVFLQSADRKLAHDTAALLKKVVERSELSA